MTQPATLPYSNEPDAGGVVSQTLALLVDSFRDLQSRKLFWVTLVLSGLVAGVFAFVGIDSTGISIFFMHVPLPLNSNLISPADFYKFLFTTLAIPWWLGLFSAVLGLVTVSGVFPELISSGSIDVYLSRPISRLRLFLTRYVFGLMFMALQVLLFSFVSFLVIGIRGGSWEFGIFLAVPLVTLFFSYLYCVCVLVGIKTRSSLAAILMTTLFWAFLGVIHVTDVAYARFVAAADERVAQYQGLVAANNRMIEANNALPSERRGNMSAFEFQRDSQQEQLVDFQATAETMHGWQDVLVNVRTVLPKTSETISLMSRWLVSPTAMQAMQDQDRRGRGNARRGRGNAPDNGPPTDLRRLMGTEEVETRVDEVLGARDLPWIVGTSVAFEAVILGIGAWIFCRRDF